MFGLLDCQNERVKPQSKLDELEAEMLRLGWARPLILGVDWSRGDTQRFIRWDSASVTATENNGKLVIEIDDLRCVCGTVSSAINFIVSRRCVPPIVKLDCQNEFPQLRGDDPPPETPEQRETRLRTMPATVTTSDVMFLCRLLDESRIMVAELAGKADRNLPSAAAIDVGAWLAGRPVPTPCDWIGALRRRDYEPPI